MARLMSSTELYQRLERGEDLVVVDVLPAAVYAREHIPGAINIPLDDLAQRAIQTLSKLRRVVVYADNHQSVASSEAARTLEDLGFRKVADFDGGLDAWKKAGYLTEAARRGGEVP